MSILMKININAVLQHGEFLRQVQEYQTKSWINAGMAGRKPSQTTALDAILEVAQKYKKEVLTAAERS